MTLFAVAVLFALACVVVYDALVTGAQAEQTEHETPCPQSEGEGE